MDLPPQKRPRKSSPVRGSKTQNMKCHAADATEPGFFDLNLRLLLEVDPAEKEYMRDEQEMELDWSHPCVHPVIKNIMAILNFTRPYQKNKAITELEKVHKEYPDNLNTMANLIRMRKELKQDCTDVENRLKNAIESNNEIEIARVELEKGYVYLMDLHSETKTSVGQKLEQANEQLRLQLLDERRSQLREHYERALKLSKEAEQIMKNIPVSCTLSTKRSRELSTRLFENGIAKLMKLQDTEDEVAIWKHYLGKTYNRLGTTHKGVERTGNKKDSFLKALKLFVFVIEHLSARFDNDSEDKDDKKDNGLRNCLARTYAYLGNLVKVKKKVIVSKADENPPEGLGSGIGITIWNDPMHAFVKAEEISEDRVILNRLALTLRRDDKPDFPKAEEYLEKSLAKFPKTNWFALSNLTELYVEWYVSELNRFNNKTQNDSSEPPRDELLSKAIKRGKQCLKQKTTTETLLSIAKAYYYLGIKSNKNTKLEHRVRDESSIRKAFMYVQRTKDRHECSHHSDMYALLGKCLFHLGDVDEAIKQMQLAIESEGKNVKEPTNFKHFCEFLLENYKSQQKNDYHKKCQELVRLLWLIIGESVRKYRKRIDYQLIGIANNYPHPIIHLIQYIKKQEDQYGPETARTVGILLKTLCRHKGPRVQQRATDEKVSLPSDFGEVSSTAENGDTIPKSVCSSEPEVNISPTHEFDFYVCHSKGDADWVHKIFVDRIEESSYKGCLRGRDIGREENIESLFKKCRKFIFVISENFNNNKQCKYELETILLWKMERNPKTDQNSKTDQNPETDQNHPETGQNPDTDIKDVLPVFRGGNYPDSLNTILSLDFSKPSYEFDKLLRSIQDIETDEDQDGEDDV